jgi:hypothetical protein
MSYQWQRGKFLPLMTGVAVNAVTPRERQIMTTPLRKLTPQYAALLRRFNERASELGNFYVAIHDPELHSLNAQMEAIELAFEQRQQERRACPEWNRGNDGAIELVAGDYEAQMEYYGDFGGVEW